MSGMTGKCEEGRMDTGKRDELILQESEEGGSHNEV
jgi:hypothetical protein